MKQPMSFSPFSTRLIAGLTLGIGLAFASGIASAAVLYEQSPLDKGVGYHANPNVPQQMADDFTLTSAASLEGISWWGGYDIENGGLGDQGDDSFWVRLFSGISGTGLLLQEYASVTYTSSSTSLLDVAGNAVYQYNFSLPSALNLSSGNYFLAVQNMGTSDWFWQAGSSGNGLVWYRGEDTDNWNSSSSKNLAFRLNGTPAQIPEPGSLALLLLAGAVLGFSRRRPLAG